MSKIKICGLKRPEDIQAANEIRPDFCGFVVEVERSSRCVTREQVRRLAEILDRQIRPVGVFADAPVELVAQLLEEGTLDMAQLHGNEDMAYIDKLRQHTGKAIIKAFSIRTSEDMENALACTSDYILLDHGTGGTGAGFDWSLTRSANRPFFLAGGLGPENLKKALEEINPWAVDLSSSLETNGYKDPDKMRAAVEIVRNHKGWV